MSLRALLDAGAAATLWALLVASPTLAGNRQADSEIVPPQVLVKTQRAPLFPPAAHAARFSGSVVVRTTILVDGTVGETVVVESNHPNVGFEEAALEAVRHWRFRPALLRGDPVEYTTQYRLNFDRRLAGSFASPMAHASIEGERGTMGSPKVPGEPDRPRVSVSPPRGDRTVPAKK